MQLRPELFMQERRDKTKTRLNIAIHSPFKQGGPHHRRSLWYSKSHGFSCTNGHAGRS